MKPLSVEQRSWLESACSLFEGHRERVLPYLDGRGISLQAAEEYRLGLVPDGVAGFEQYAGMLAIPYLTRNGPVTFKFRRLDDGKPKYLGLSGRNHLYNVSALFDATDTLCICEGELDALALSMHGVPAVGIPGANNWQSHYRYVLSDFSRIVVLCDGDEPGRGLGKLLQEKVDARPVHLPDGMDVSDMLMQPDGLEWIRERL